MEKNKQNKTKKRTTSSAAIQDVGCSTKQIPHSHIILTREPASKLGLARAKSKLINHQRHGAKSNPRVFDQLSLRTTVAFSLCGSTWRIQRRVAGQTSYPIISNNMRADQ